MSINDAILTPEALKSPVRLAAGGYRVVAEAPGYARQKDGAVVSGQKDQPFVLTLSPLSGMCSSSAPTIHKRPSPSTACRSATRNGKAQRRPVPGIYVYADPEAQEQRRCLRRPDDEFDAKLTAQDAIPEENRRSQNGPPLRAPVTARSFRLSHFRPRFHGKSGASRVEQRQGTRGRRVRQLAHRLPLFHQLGRGVHGRKHRPRDRRLRRERGHVHDREGQLHVQLHAHRTGHAADVERPQGALRRHRGAQAAGAHDQVRHRSQSPPTRNAEDQTATGSVPPARRAYELNLGHFLLDAGLVFTVETADEQKIGIRTPAAAASRFASATVRGERPLAPLSAGPRTGAHWSLFSTYDRLRRRGGRVTGPIRSEAPLRALVRSR